jgi:DNA invertase Pin-like site-specific DNA recombinase
MKKKTVAVYARVSTDKQKVDMQLQELNEFIKRSGWKLYKQYIDHGLTGANTKRPDFLRFQISISKSAPKILLMLLSQHVF